MTPARGLRAARRSPVQPALLRWLLALTLLLSLGCSRDRRDDCGEEQRVVDPVLLAFLSQARSAHHLADQREAAGDVTAAIQALDALTSGPRPPGGAPEVAEVLADTRARLADLLSRASQFERAERELSLGLESAPARSYFQGHLLEVRGLLEERREKKLRAEGREAEAGEARSRSLAAYEEAMKVQADVIRAAAPSAAPSAPPAPRP